MLLLFQLPNSSLCDLWVKETYSQGGFVLLCVLCEIVHMGAVCIGHAENILALLERGCHPPSPLQEILTCATYLKEQSTTVCALAKFCSDHCKAAGTFLSKL